MTKSRITAFSLVAVALMASAIAYPRLPATVPLHWDAHGNPNTYGSRLLAVLIAPGVMAFVAFVTQYWTRVPVENPGPDESGKDRTRAAWDYQILGMISLIGLLLLHLSVLAAIIKLLPRSSIPAVTIAVMSLLVILIGNYIPRARQPNPLFGLRLPWLTDANTWRRAQRVNGYGLVAVGTASLVALAFSQVLATDVFLVSVVMHVAFLSWYSYHTRKGSGIGRPAPTRP